MRENKAWERKEIEKSRKILKDNKSEHSSWNWQLKRKKNYIIKILMIFKNFDLNLTSLKNLNLNSLNL